MKESHIYQNELKQFRFAILMIVLFFDTLLGSMKMQAQDVVYREVAVFGDDTVRYVQTLNTADSTLDFITVEDQKGKVLQSYPAIYALEQIEILKTTYLSSKADSAIFAGMANEDRYRYLISLFLYQQYLAKRQQLNE